MIDVLIVIGTFLIYLLAFMIAITFHEVGHFVAARIFGIKVESFSVGYGKKLWSFKDKYDTEWIFRLFCFGGHVKLAGEDRFKPNKSSDQPVFSQLALGKRFLTVLAGPIFGFLLPFLILVPAYIFMGQPHYHPVINTLEIGKAAEEAGFEIGDRIIEINGEKIIGNRDTIDYLKKTPPEELDIVVERGEEQKHISITPFVVDYRDSRGLHQEHSRIGVHLTNMPGNLYYIEAVNGIPTNKNIDKARELILDNLDEEVVLTLESDIEEDRQAEYRAYLSSESNKGLLDPEDEYYDFYFPGDRNFGFYADLSVTEAFKLGVTEAATIIRGIFGIPLQYFPVDREKLKPYSHPSRDASEFKYWLFSLIYATILLSVALGFINLLPFPGLDGCYLLYYAVESFKGPEFVIKNRGILVAGSLFVIYMIVLSANIDDIGPYLESLKDRMADKADIIKQTKI